MTDPIVDAVCAKLQSRSAVGLKKYGTTLADNAATVKEKLTHIQEELMDGANYVEWLLQDYFSYGVSPAMEAVKMMDVENNRRLKELQEKKMPTPMTIEMEAESLNKPYPELSIEDNKKIAALLDFNKNTTQYGLTLDEKEIDDRMWFVHPLKSSTVETIRDVLLTKTPENVTCEKLSNADGRQAALDIVNEQAKDDGLWFVAKYASEAYLQQELRRLHKSIELAALQSPRVPEPTSIENVAMEDTWLREKIGIALGEASMCWSETPKGVFHSERATEILNDLCCQIDTRKSPRVPDDAKYHELCKQCWDALGITEYTGKHIAEHIKELRSTRVPVIEGLDEAIDFVDGYACPHGICEPEYKTVIIAARAYAELQKGV